MMLTVLAALALLIANLAPSVAPKSFWPIAFLGLGFTFILFFNVLLSIFWMIRKNWKFIIPIVAIALCWKNVQHTVSFKDPGKPGEKNKTLRLMSFNVKNFDVYDNEDHKAHRKGMMDLIESEGADIVCIQEFYNQDKKGHQNIAFFLDSLGYRHHYFHITTRFKKVHEFGLALFSKHPIINKKAIKFENSRNNASIYADVFFEGDTVRVYNVHLQSIHFGEADYKVAEDIVDLSEVDMQGTRSIARKIRTAFYKRNDQVDLLKAHVSNAPHPVLLAGDFNDTPVSYTYAGFSDLLKDSFKEAGMGFGGSYNGPLPNFRIDYIFYDDAFRCYDHQVHKKDLSDHYAIVADLEVM